MGTIIKIAKVLVIIFFQFLLAASNAQVNIEWSVAFWIEPWNMFNPNPVRDVDIINNFIYVSKSDTILIFNRSGKIIRVKSFSFDSLKSGQGIKNVSLNNKGELLFSGNYWDTTLNKVNYFLYKYDTLLNTLFWSKDSIGGGYLIVDKKNNIVTKNILGKLIKMDNNGNILWVDSVIKYGPIDTFGSIYNSYTDIGTGIYHITKYDSLRIKQWEYQFSGIQYTIEAVGIGAIDGLGNVYSNGWMMSYCGGDQDYFAIKVDSSGVQQWTACYNGTGNWVDKAVKLTVASDGSVYVTGESCPPGGCCTNAVSCEEIATIKYDSFGAEQWAQRYTRPGGGFNSGYNIILDDSGYIYVSGPSIDPSHDTAGSVIIKYSAVGNNKWVLNNTNYELGRLYLDKQNNIYAIGDKGNPNENFLIKHCQYRSQSLFTIDTATANSGDTLSFTNSSWNATWWQWDYGNGVVDSVNYNGKPVYDTAGTYTVILIAWNGCGKDTMQQTVTVQKGCNYLQAAFTAGSDTIEMGAPVQFTDTGSDAEAWFWNFGDGMYDTLQNPTHVYDSTGTYTVMLAVTNNYNGLCVDTVYSSITVVLPVIVKEMGNRMQLSHKPNPATGEVVFTFTLPATGDVTIKLFNILGGGVAKVYEGTVEAGKTLQVRFDVARLEQGVYFYKMETGSGNAVRRMIVVK